MRMVQEVMRIKGQHLNDRNAIVNGRVKGKINVTRAFGVAYLKQVTSVLLVFRFQCACSSIFLLSVRPLQFVLHSTAAFKMCSSSEHALCIVL